METEFRTQTILKNEARLKDFDPEYIRPSSVRQLLSKDSPDIIKNALSDISTAVGEIIGGVPNSDHTVSPLDDLIRHHNEQVKNQNSINLTIVDPRPFERKFMRIQFEASTPPLEITDPDFLLEQLLPFAFWFNKIAKYCRDHKQNPSSASHQIALAEKNETWAYDMKDAFLSCVTFFLINDNYENIKSWGFSEHKRSHILHIDYPGHEPYSFHVPNLDRLLPRTHVLSILSGDYRYPYSNITHKNHLGIKFTPQQLTFFEEMYAKGTFAPLTRLTPQQNFQGNLESLQHLILVGLGRCDELPSIHKNIPLPPPIPPNKFIPLEREFIPGEVEIRRERLIEHILNARGTLRESILNRNNIIYIQHGNNIDIKAARHALEEWWKEETAAEESRISEADHDPFRLIQMKKGLTFIPVGSGETVTGQVNFDNSNKTNSTIDEPNTGTTIIDAEFSRKYGAISTVSALWEKLHLKIPEQIRQFADNPPSSDIVTNPDYVYVYANGTFIDENGQEQPYLTGKEVFKLAKEFLLDKKLTPEIIEKYHLNKAVQIQKKLVENISGAIDRTIISGNVAICPTFVRGASAAIFHKFGNRFFVGLNVKDDSFGFAILTNRSKIGLQLPEKIHSLAQEWTDKGVFVSPNGQMIIAGGEKASNPHPLNSQQFFNQTFSDEELTNKLIKYFQEIFQEN